ncbi:glutaredoxin domain-containing protein [Selenomonas sp.]|jgi:glutaredoxin 3|uniref:glutaredoxin domain-containing protein n=1 Tax=Selenomonas sp. TaxID=2053611 RepID=UPI003A0FD5E3
MKKLTMIVMQGCPYCAAAKRAVKELKAEQAVYAPLVVEELEDGSAAAQAYGKDYYYVPSIFIEGEKCFEAQPGQSDVVIKQAVARAFDRALRD